MVTSCPEASASSIACSVASRTRPASAPDTPARSAAVWASCDLFTVSSSRSMTFRATSWRARRSERVSGGSGAGPGERHVRDSAWRGGGLDVVVVLEALQSVPEPHAPPEQDRDDHDVHVVDEPGSKELADHGGTAADAHVLVARGLTGPFERLGRRRVEEVERRAALHLDRRARVMGEDEDRCVERRVGAPRALPFRVLVPSGVAELPGPHDLGADPPIVPLEERVVDAAAAAGPPPPGGEHPLVQPVPGVTEVCVAALALTGAETVERDGEAVDVDDLHGGCSFDRGQS